MFIKKWDLDNAFPVSFDWSLSLATDKPVALRFRIELEFENVGFWGEGKTGVTGEKPLRAGDNWQQTQPTYDAGSSNQTWATLVGGKRSHYCPTLAPPNTEIWVFGISFVLPSTNFGCKIVAKVLLAILGILGKFWVLWSLFSGYNTTTPPPPPASPQPPSWPTLNCFPAIFAK